MEKRIKYLDVAKGILMLAVIWGHIVTNTQFCLNNTNINGSVVP